MTVIHEPRSGIPIAEAAEISGVSTHTLRYHERAANLAIVDTVEKVAADAAATPAQVALAWLLAQGEHIAPIPGTRRLARVEENIAAVDLELSADQLATLDAVATPVGERYEDMTSIER